MCGGIHLYALSDKSVSNVFLIKFLRLQKIIYICKRLSYLLHLCLRWPAPGRMWRSHYRLNHTKRALGGKRESRHIEGVYFDALFETHRNLANLRIKVLNLATVDARGVIYITAFGVSCQPELYPFGHKGFLYLYIVGMPKLERYTFISAWALTLSVQLQ